MTRQLLKTSLTLSLGMVLGAELYSCASGLSIKVYEVDPQRGLVRKQAGEIMSWDQAKGYYCMSPTDTQTIITEWKACQNAGAQ